MKQTDGFDPHRSPLACVASVSLLPASCTQAGTEESCFALLNQKPASKVAAACVCPRLPRSAGRLPPPPLAQVLASNGVIYFVDQVLIPGQLCPAFADYNAWQCCGGCAGCATRCAATREAEARGNWAGSGAAARGGEAGASGGVGGGAGPPEVLVDRACSVFCQVRALGNGSRS